MEEIVVFDLAIVVAWGDIEDGFSSVEVEMNSGWFSDRGFPAWVFIVDEEIAVGVDPSIFEALDVLIVGFHSCGDN